MSFSKQWRGDRISLKDDDTVAVRTESYNGGIVYSAEPLDTGDVFTVRLDAMEKGWAGSLKFGITSRDPSGQTVPKGILELYNRPDFWVLSGNKLHHNHSEVSYQGPSLESLSVGDTVGVHVTAEGDLHYVVKGEDTGKAIGGVTTDEPIYVVADIYGQAKQISIIESIPKDVIMRDVEPFEISESSQSTWPSVGGSMVGAFPRRSKTETSSEEETDEDEEDDEDHDDEDDEGEESSYSDPDEFGRTG